MKKTTKKKEVKEPVSKMVKILAITGGVWGLLSFIGMLVALIPCVGWLNWFIIPLASFGIIVNFAGIILGFMKKAGKLVSSPIIGLLLCFASLIGGSIRLILGGFVL